MDPTIATILGVILGALLTGSITYCVSKNLMGKQEFNKSAALFRDAFIEEKRFIDRFYAVGRAGKDIPEILAASADKHERALVIFKDGYLDKMQRLNIEETWKIYTGEDKHLGKYTFKQYTTKGKIKDAEKNRKIALERIEKLLSFAKPK